MKINRIEKDGEVSYSVEGFSSAEIGKRLKEALQRMSWKRYFKRNPEKNRKKAKNVDDYKIELSWERTGDEQMFALESAITNCAYSEYQDCLKELMNQLKKLTE